FAVIDTETTGIIAGMQHRITEIAIIHTDARGVVTDEWSTLLNPERDLGPQGIHGIHAADVRNAPTFDAIAGDITERLRGRVVVAHNWPFDARHLRSEFTRLELDTVSDDDAGLCTMRVVDAAMLGSGRSLIDCCAAAGLSERDWHTARDDALAAAELLAFLLEHHPTAGTPTAAQLPVAHGACPNLACGVAAPVERTPVEQVEPHFLARIAHRIPCDEEPVVDRTSPCSTTPCSTAGSPSRKPTHSPNSPKNSAWTKPTRPTCTTPTCANSPKPPGPTES